MVASNTGSILCLQIPFGNNACLLQYIPSVKQNHLNSYYSIDLATSLLLEALARRK